ncbi:hypothetical protein MED297_09831 [Reinekea sp. MED297]|uniref:Uncharacterized protein n=1 Tax=Reinekea blandensis MED297 TaxID=314283 RepID=A4BA44_9GAMM|nr:hypothetical protein MED297_09831 [Reinekea sp. MED297] [Reinekea blandensis MED297]
MVGWTDWLLFIDRKESDLNTSVKAAMGLTLVPVLVLAALVWLRGNLHPEEAPTSRLPTDPAADVISDLTASNTPTPKFSVDRVQPASSAGDAVTVTPPSDLLRWYSNQPTPEVMSLFFEPDEQRLQIYVEKANEDIEGFLALVASVQTDDPYLGVAVWDALSVRDYDRLLPYLTVSETLADVAFNKGLHRNNPSAFDAAYKYWQTQSPSEIPKGVLLSAMEFGKEGSFEVARSFVVEREHPLEVFEMLAIYDQPDLASLARSVWQTAASDFGSVDSFDRAILAAQYAGSRDALLEISNLITHFPLAESEFYRMKLSFIRVPDLDELHDKVLMLEYVAEERAWELME